MKEIKLTNRGVALVDDSDFKEINKFSWFSVPLGYAARNKKINGRQTVVLMHRQILQLSDSSVFCDHKNGNGLDNRRKNIRIATHAQNMANRSSAKGSKSKYLGVSFMKRRGKWRARVQKNNKRIHVGTFDDEASAAKAYDEVARRVHGEFANLNFPE